MSFHLYKQTRQYVGEPYCGPSSNYQRAEYPDLKSAQIAAKQLQECNPVGWNIFDADTGKLVDETETPIAL